MTNRSDSGNLSGGTQRVDPSRTINVSNKDAGTPGITTSVGDVHTGATAQTPTVTGLADQGVEVVRLAGGQTPERIKGYLDGVEFPALKDTIIRAARRNGAPEDVFGSLTLLNATQYGSMDEVLDDYPRLPDRDAIDSTKGRT